MRFLAVHHSRQPGGSVEREDAEVLDARGNYRFGHSVLEVSDELRAVVTKYISALDPSRTVPVAFEARAFYDNMEPEDFEQSGRFVAEIAAERLAHEDATAAAEAGEIQPDDGLAFMQEWELQWEVLHGVTREYAKDGKGFKYVWPVKDKKRKPVA